MDRKKKEEIVNNFLGELASFLLENKLDYPVYQILIYSGDKMIISKLTQKRVERLNVEELTNYIHPEKLSAPLHYIFVDNRGKIVIAVLDKKDRGFKILKIN